MNKISGVFLLAIMLFCSCGNLEKSENNKERGKDLGKILDAYWEERMQLYPLEATAKGDYRYNDKLTITIAESFRDSAKKFYQKYLDMDDMQQHIPMF